MTVSYLSLDESKSSNVVGVNLGNVSTHNDSVDVGMTFTTEVLAVPQELDTHLVAEATSSIPTYKSIGNVVGITSDEQTTPKTLCLLTLQWNLLSHAMSLLKQSQILVSIY